MCARVLAVLMVVRNFNIIIAAAKLYRRKRERLRAQLMEIAVCVCVVYGNDECIYARDERNII